MTKTSDNDMDAIYEAAYHRAMDRLMAVEKNLYLVAMGTKGGTRTGFRQWVTEKYPDPEKLADALAVYLSAH